MQRVACAQGGGRFDEHGSGTKIRRLDFCHAQMRRRKPLKIGQRLLAGLGINSARSLFDPADTRHLGQGLGRDHQLFFTLAFESSHPHSRIRFTEENRAQHRGVDVDHSRSCSRISATVRPGIGGSDTHVCKSAQPNPADRGSGTRRATGFPLRVITTPWPASTSASKADRCDLASATVAVFIIKAP